MTTKVLILLGSSSDLAITESGLDYLRKAGVGFELHIASAHRSPSHVHELVQNFDKSGGQIHICVAGMSAHLAGVVAALTTRPVIAVPVARAETAGFDALLSMGQMPGGVPVATMGLGKAGFTNASILAVQILALKESKLSDFLRSDRAAMVDKVIAEDQKHAITFAGK